MMRRGEVYMEDSIYHLVDKDAIIEELKKEIKSLKENKDKIAKESKTDELEEAKIQWEYWEWMARKYWKYCDEIMDICYNKVKAEMGSKFTESRESFKEWIGNMIKRPTE